MRQYQVTFAVAIQRAFANYCNFKGRASRSEYWWFYLFVVLVSWLLAIPMYWMIIKTSMTGGFDFEEINVSGWSSLTYLWNLAVLLPSLGLLFRRLHDTGRSGWNCCWLLLPFIGVIIILVYLCSESQPFANKYGEIPNLETDPF